MLSNPSIRAKHAQPAMISVGRTNAYVREVDVTNTAGGTTNQTQTDVTVDSVFDGLMIGVVPFITSDGRISLTIHPIQSDVDAASLQLVDISTDSKVSLPQVDLKEISTVLDLNNNDVVLLGGLIDKRRSKVRSGVPFLSEVPVVGRAFTSNTNSESVRELVIMLRASIL